MRPTKTWQPLLAGELADQAWEAILDVAAALETAIPAQSSAEKAALLTDPSLSRGLAGLALFYAYLAEIRAEERYADLAVACIEQAMDAMASQAMGPALHGGFTGVAWTAEHLEGRLFEPDDEPEETEPEVDLALGELLRPGTWRNYDLINGLVGFGVYALEALPRATARECLDLVVAHLDQLAEEHSAGVTWFTPPDLLPPHQRKQAPQGYYNCGVAHGVAGVIAFLGAVCAAGPAADRAQSLLDQAVAWLLSQEQAAEVGSAFPHFLGGDLKPHASRLAWCYGDLGVASALLVAARQVGQGEWEREALRFARAMASRPAEQSMIRDAGLCHGAAGAGHLFNRLWQATGEEELGTAARFWLRAAIEMRRPGEGIGGYFAWSPAQGGWVADRGFLTGATGIALPLLAAVSSVEPQWDRALLTAIPLRRQ